LWTANIYYVKYFCHYFR